MIADVAENELFSTLGGFKGKVGYVEMSNFYIDNLSKQTVGWQSAESQKFQSSLIDFNFDIAAMNQPLINRGAISQKQFTILGNYQPLSEIDPTQSGVKFNDESYLNIQNVDFRQNNSPV